MLKIITCFILGGLFILAGANHFRVPGFYKKMTPDFLPFVSAINYISGVVEILGGIGLMIPATRVYAAWGLIILLVAVFPANINMALHPEQWHFSKTGLYIRLPLQLVFIWWTYQYTK
jgi:uncharacterized membrane protein